MLGEFWAHIAGFSLRWRNPITLWTQFSEKLVKEMPTFKYQPSRQSLQPRHVWGVTRPINVVLCSCDHFERLCCMVLQAPSQALKKNQRTTLIGQVDYPCQIGSIREPWAGMTNMELDYCKAFFDFQRLFCCQGDRHILWSNWLHHGTWWKGVFGRTKDWLWGSQVIIIGCPLQLSHMSYWH